MKTILFAAAAALTVPAIAPAAAPTAAAAPTQGHPGMHEMKPMSRADVAERVKKQFAAMDSNHDGAITSAEGDAAAAAMEKRMAEHGAKHAMKPAAMRAHMFANTDLNKDGRVTLEEATKAAQQHFDSVDANHDGTLTVDEMRSARQKMGGHHG